MNLNLRIMFVKYNFDSNVIKKSITIISLYRFFLCNDRESFYSMKTNRFNNFFNIYNYSKLGGKFMFI